MASQQLGAMARTGGGPTGSHGHGVAAGHGQHGGGSGYFAGRESPGQADSVGVDPGDRSVGSGGQRQPGGKVHNSWAEMLSSTLPSSWNKNVMECVLEKDDRGPFYVNEKDCARMMQKVGLDTRPGIHVKQSKFVQMEEELSSSH